MFCPRVAIKQLTGMREKQVSHSPAALKVESRAGYAHRISVAIPHKALLPETAGASLPTYQP